MTQLAEPCPSSVGEMSNPRDWRAPDDEPPAGEYVRRGHEWSWNGEGRSSMHRAEQWMRYGIWGLLVVAFIVMGIGLLVR